MKRTSHGYTLIELAISIMIIGMIVAGGSVAYTLYMKDKRFRTTQLVLEDTETAIGGFRSLYGRYPCPASPTAQPGDADYGHEDCTGASLIEVTSDNPALTDPRIWIGSVPFRQLNMSERQSVDGYFNRLTYAVTASLTNDVTYRPDGGGISLIDLNDESVLDPADSGHFVLFSHGPDGVGAVTRDGVALPCDTGTLQSENCNNDQIFRQATWQADYDDMMTYFINVPLQEWQYANNPAHVDDIHLRRTNRLLMLSDDPAQNVIFASSTPAFDVRGTMTDNTNIRVSDGTVRTVRLCDEIGGNCFEPNVIGGDTTTGGGLYCPSGQFLQKIAGNSVQCVPEIVFACPPGSFFRGFSNAGRLLCDEPPGEPCPSAAATTYCGTTATLPPTSSGQAAAAYSGMCHNLANLTTAQIAEINALPSIAAIESYLASLNNTTRTDAACGPTASNGQVRDTYQCENGVWSASIRQRARGNYGSNFSSNLLQASNANHNAAMSFVPEDPLLRDRNNTQANHHCWCREDYRVRTVACPTGFEGNGFTVEKHRCPQTGHTWQAVHTVNNAFCTCVERTDEQTQSCASYYGRTTSEVSGNIRTVTPYTCVNNSPVAGETVTTHNCQCTNQQPSYATTACPSGTGNSFTYNGRTYNNVAQIRQRNWTCPGGPAPQPVNSNADLGFWSAYSVVHNEPCTCVPRAPRTETRACPAGTEGPGITYRVEWDCATNNWRPESEWVMVSNNCNSCSWQQPSGTPSLSNVTTPNQIGAQCNNCGAIGQCWAPAAGGRYYVYSGCQCRS